MDNMYYFFGAGNNCCGAIQYWGEENVIALVDNSVARVGSTLMGLPIISFDDFIQQYKGEKVIITSNLHAMDIIEQLYKEEIKNIYICPFMAYGFISAKQIVKRGNLEKFKHVYILQGDPLLEEVYNVMNNKDRCTFVSDFNDISETENAIAVVYEKKEIKGELSIYCVEEDNIKYQKENMQKLEKYHNLHQGGNCVIIGNGPSLSVSDLDTLYENKVICLASNNISKVYDKTKWRPTYHFWGDGVAFDQAEKRLNNESVYFINSLYKCDGINNKVEYFYGLFERYYPGYPTFSTDITQGIYGGRTVTYSMLQVAAYMGFKNIYLLGVDFSWGEDKKGTHFYNDEDESTELRVKEATKYKDEIEHAYVSAKRYADNNNIRIINATRGGKLEVFERVNFDELFESD